MATTADDLTPHLPLAWAGVIVRTETGETFLIEFEGTKRGVDGVLDVRHEEVEDCESDEARSANEQGWRHYRPGAPYGSAKIFGDIKSFTRLKLDGPPDWQAITALITPTPPTEDQPRPRYLVVGSTIAISRWAREGGHRRRDYIAVTSAGGVRGVTRRPDLELVLLPGWRGLREQNKLADNLAIAGYELPPGEDQ